MRILLIAILCLLPFAGEAENMAVPTIQITGEHVLQVAPDIAYVDITVYAKDLQHTEAKRKADELLRSAKRVAESLNIHEKNIKTNYVNVNPVYDYINNQQKLTGYEAQYALRVTVEKLGDVGLVIEQFIKAGIDRIGGVQYSIKNDEAAKLLAMSKAVANAKLKAQTLADAAGVSLGAPISINESGSNSPAPIYMARSAVAMSDAMAEKSFSGEIPPKGEINVQANVNMVFEIK
jgi:uncharacterized protein YggE